MKLTKARLKRIIKEELKAVRLIEGRGTYDLKGGDKVSHKNEPERGIGTVRAVDLAKRVVSVAWENGTRQRHDPSSLKLIKEESAKILRENEFDPIQYEHVAGEAADKTYALFVQDMMQQWEDGEAYGATEQEWKQRIESAEESLKVKVMEAIDEAIEQVSTEVSDGRAARSAL